MQQSSVTRMKKMRVKLNSSAKLTEATDKKMHLCFMLNKCEDHDKIVSQVVNFIKLYVVTRFIGYCLISTVVYIETRYKYIGLCCCHIDGCKLLD